MSTATAATAAAAERLHASRFEASFDRTSKADVERLRGSVHIEHTLATLGANRLWELLHSDPSSRRSARSRQPGLQMVRAGLKAIYLSGWQVAPTRTWPGRCTPISRSIPRTACPPWCAASTRPLERADQIEHGEGKSERNCVRPIIADAEAGFAARSTRSSS